MSPAIVDVESSSSFGQGPSTMFSSATADDVVSSDSDSELPITIRSISTGSSSSQTSAESVCNGTSETAGSKCIICSAIVQNEAFELHRAYHARYDGKITCDFEGCCYQSSTNGNMRAHRRAHYGDHPYLCMERACYQRFMTAESLWTHRHEEYHEQSARKDKKVREDVTRKYFRESGSGTQDTVNISDINSRAHNKGASGMHTIPSDLLSSSTSRPHPYHDPSKPRHASFYAIITTLDTLVISPSSTTSLESPPRLCLPDPWLHEIVRVDPIVNPDDDGDFERLEYDLVPQPANLGNAYTESSSQPMSMLSWTSNKSFLAFTIAYSTTTPPRELCLVFRFRRTGKSSRGDSGAWRFAAARAELEKIVEANQGKGRGPSSGRGSTRGRGRGNRLRKGKGKEREMGGQSSGPAVALDQTFFDFVRSTIPKTPGRFKAGNDSGVALGGLDYPNMGENQYPTRRAGGRNTEDIYTSTGDSHSYTAPARITVQDDITMIGSSSHSMVTQSFECPPQDIQALPGSSSVLHIPPQLQPARIADTYLQTTSFTNASPWASGYWNIGRSTGTPQIPGTSGSWDTPQGGSAIHQIPHIPQAPQVPPVAQSFPELMTSSLVPTPTDTPPSDTHQATTAVRARGKVASGRISKPKGPQTRSNTRNRKRGSIVSTTPNGRRGRRGQQPQARERGHFGGQIHSQPDSEDNDSQAFLPATNTIFDPLAFSTTTDVTTSGGGTTSSTQPTPGAPQSQLQGQQGADLTWKEAPDPWLASSWSCDNSGQGDFAYPGFGVGATLAAGIENGMGGPSHWGPDLCVPGPVDPTASFASAPAPNVYGYEHY